MKRLLHAAALAAILTCNSNPAMSITDETGAEVTPSIDVSYVVPRSAMLLPTYERIKNGRLLEGVQEILTPYRLPRKLLVQIDECDGAPNAFYRNGSVEICYELLPWIERFATANSSLRSSRAAAYFGTLLQILLQKISLGFFDILQIPMFGSEESAADQLAAFMTLQFSEGRGALLGLASFYESLITRPNDTTDADRFFARRIQDALCIAYGADPQQFSAVVERQILPESRALRCADEYRRVRFAFAQLILPYVDLNLVQKVRSIPWQQNLNGGGFDDPEDRRIVPLLFTTTRAIRGSGADKTFTDERSPELSFGALRVRIPEGHKTGNVERPWVIGIGWTFYRQGEDDHKHFVLKGITHFDRSTFFDSLRKQGLRQDTKKQALIFVHGFNNTFEDSAFRLAQIVFDTQFQGIPILFSWPARGAVLSYVRDISSARYSSDAFLELLQLIQKESQLDAIHVIAHSMGNEIVLDALTKGNNALRAPLTEVVLAAPDVDRDVFVKQAVKILQVAKGVTIYASSADKAMLVSKMISAGTPRAGDVLPSPAGPVVLPGIDTIDVTAVGSEIFGLEHNTFAGKRALIGEIGRLLSSSTRPVNERSPEIRGVPEGVKPPRYWWYPP